MFDLNNKEKRIYFSFVRILVSIIIIIASLGILQKIFNIIINYKYVNALVIRQDDEPRIKVTVDDNTKGDSMFIKDEKGIRFRKSDKSLARDEWIDNRGELFYFDSTSYGKNGDLRFEGQIYTFVNGSLKKITIDKNYVTSFDNKHFNSVDSSQFMAYLDDQDETNESNNYYPVKYIAYGDNTDDYLGGKSDKQYCSANLLKINNNTIYYLALGSPNEFVGNLYRLKPNAENKEYVGNNIKGYIVLSQDVVYVYNGQIVRKVKDWQKEKINVTDDTNQFYDALNSIPLDDNKESEIEPTAQTINSPTSPEKEETVKDKNQNSEVIPIETTEYHRAVVGQSPGQTSRDNREPQVSIDIVPR